MVTGPYGRDVRVLVSTLRGAVAVGVAVVAAQTAVVWWRRRGTGQGYLASSICLIAAATGLRGLGDAVGGSAGRVLVEAALVSFAASGVALLSYRHSLVPVDSRHHVVVTAATAAVVAGAVTARAAVSPESAVALAGGGAVVVVWLASVAEPVVTFWRLADARSPLQRARLRALATAYVLVAVVAVAFVVTERVESAAAQVALHSLSLLALPVMYAGLAVPSWLRRWWRQPVERAARLALLDVVGGDDAEVVATAAVGWARQLVGGTAAAVVDETGNVLASTGEHEDELRRLASAGTGPHAELARDELGREGHGVVAPLGRDGASGALVVLADPLAPMLRGEEVDRLGDLALALTAVFDRFDALGILARQTDRYEKLLQAITDMGVAFLIVDRRTDRVVFANDAMTRLTGHSRDELFSLPTFAELLAPGEIDAVVRRVDEGGIGEILSEALETVAVRRDGSLVMVEVSAKVTDDGAHVVALVRDVSERQRVAAQDRRRLRQLAALAGAAGTLARESTETARLLPAVADAARRVLASTWATVRVVDGAGTSGPSATAGERTAWGDELAVPLVRGEETVGVLYLGPKDATDGDASGFDEIDAAAATAFASLAAEAVAVSRAFAREAELVDQLKALDRMKDTFLNAVSHELRTPLAVILGMSETLARRRDELDADESDRMLRGVTRNAEKLDRLLNDLLDIDRLNRGILQPHRRPADLTLLVESVLADTGLRDRRTVTVDVEPLVAALDAPKVERVLENLLRNAERHTPDGTPIWVRLTRAPDGVLLAVEDAGDGVPEDLRGSVFEPFERGVEGGASATGVGIGLSLVARFAELHGGRAWVVERPGGGASFRVLLVSDDVTEPAEEVRSAPAAER